MWKIAVDVMGADHGVMPIVQGAIAAAKARECKVLLVGDESTDSSGAFPKWCRVWGK